MGLSRRDLLLLSFCLLLCLGLGAYSLRAAPLLFHADAVHYISLGQALARGQGYHASQLVFPDLMQPPLYPLLIALFTPIVGSPVAAAIVICLAANLGVVVAALLLHTAIWGAPGRLWTALLAAVCANVALSAELLLEPLFLCLSAFALYLLVRALQARHIPRAAAAGLLLGLSLLVRPEAVLAVPVVVGLILLWPAVTIAGRLRLLFALAAAAAAVIVPYGLWMRAQLGFFEVLPKVRYNVPYAEINARMIWEPEEARLGTRDQRGFFTLMPDRSTFVMNYAFAHPEFDARTQFPLRPASDGRQPDQLREVLYATRQVIKDGVMVNLAFSPLALLLLLFGAARGLGDAGPARWERRLLTLALLALVAGNLLPAMASGIDYMPRYQMTSILFSLPLVGAGVAPLSAWLSRRLPGLAPANLQIGIGLLLALLYLAGAVRTARAHVRSPIQAQRMVAVDRALPAHLPEGARVLAEHPRYAFQRGGFTFQLPYTRSLEELADYVHIHRIEYALLDARTLRRNPSRVNRALADPAAWPPGWRPVMTLFSDSEPIWLVRVR